MAHGNDIIHNNHFRKHWQNRVRTWFNQPARKVRRRKARDAKAIRVAPRPTSGLLRPIVSCQTIKYNMKRRAGRGFTLEELKRAGIAKKHARTIGISVDHRRNNRSLEGLNRNVARLKKYKAKLIVLPRHAKREDVDKLKQHKGKIMKVSTRFRTIKPHVPTEKEKKYSPFHAMRQHRANANLVGKRLRIKNAKAEA